MRVSIPNTHFQKNEKLESINILDAEKIGRWETLPKHLFWRKRTINRRQKKLSAEKRVFDVSVRKMSHNED